MSSRSSSAVRAGSASCLLKLVEAGSLTDEQAHDINLWGPVAARRRGCTYGRARR
jgi:hypothetical protein